MRLFFLGMVSVLLFQFAFVLQYQGDWNCLLHVGKDAQPYIEKELGKPVTTIGTIGHDGQLNYLISRDLLNSKDTIRHFIQNDNPPYRYRRILYPSLASGFGFLSPQETVYGLIFWLAVGNGLIFVSSVSIVNKSKVILWLLLCPGVYLTAQILTNDVLAIGLSLAGVATWQKKWFLLSWLLLAAAVLTRETSILVTASLAFILPRKEAIIVVTSIVPYLIWCIYVNATIPGGNGLHNLTLPVVGMVEGLSYWKSLADWTFGIVSIALIGVAIFAARFATNTFLRVSCLLWATLALIMSFEVWSVPGNALRVLSPLWIFTVMALVTLPHPSVEDKPPSN